MKIGIIGAMESEIQLLREYLGNPAPTHLRRYAFYEGQIGNHQVVVLLSGIGKVSASIGTALLIDHFAPELVINTGTAGGLRHSKVFDMVLATEVSYYDVDVTAFGYAIGQQAQMPRSYLPAEQWFYKAQESVARYTSQLHCAPIVSGDSFDPPMDRDPLSRSCSCRDGSGSYSTNLLPYGHTFPYPTRCFRQCRRRKYDLL